MPEASTMQEQRCDVLVIGGGPAGSTIATEMSQKGWQVVLLEKDHHPRFHIGESLLPLNLPLLERLGVLPQVEEIGVNKPGIEMCSGQDGARSHIYYFENTLAGRHPHAFQVRRSEFDHLLLENSKSNGVQVFEGTRVKEVETRGWGDNLVVAKDGKGHQINWKASVIVDASGRSALLATRLGMKERNNRHNSSALFGHFKNATRRQGRDEGNIGIYWFEQGWFWMIPLRDGIMSVGAVCWPEYLKSRHDDLETFFMDTIALCPAVQERLAGAELMSGPQATGNYSYKSKKMWGPGYVLVGDAYTFIDPVFSSGVYLAMSGASQTSAAIDACLRRGKAAEPELILAQRRLDKGIRKLSWFIYRFTTPAIHDLFLNPKNFLRMEEAILSLLAGDIFRKSKLGVSLLLFKTIYWAAMAVNLPKSIRFFSQKRKNLKIESSL
ncbi:MAG: NAD(P)/FAD-dependent oxidoreductase [Pseudomonadota bacterium]